MKSKLPKPALNPYGSGERTRLKKKIDNEIYEAIKRREESSKGEGKKC